MACSHEFPEDEGPCATCGMTADELVDAYQWAVRTEPMREEDILAISGRALREDRWVIDDPHHESLTSLEAATARKALEVLSSHVAGRMRSYLWACVQSMLLRPWVSRVLALSALGQARLASVEVVPHSLDPSKCYGEARHNTATGLTVVKIYATGCLTWDLATLLHELAHAAAGTSERYDHGPTWRLLYRAAASELTGREVPETRLDVDAGRAWDLADEDVMVAQDQIVMAEIHDWICDAREEGRAP